MYTRSCNIPVDFISCDYGPWVERQLPVTGQGLAWPSTLLQGRRLSSTQAQHAERGGLNSSKQEFKKINPSIFQYFQNFTRFMKGNMKCSSILRSLM